MQGTWCNLSHPNYISFYLASSECASNRTLFNVVIYFECISVSQFLKFVSEVHVKAIQPNATSLREKKNSQCCDINKRSHTHVQCNKMPLFTNGVKVRQYFWAAFRFSSADSLQWIHEVTLLNEKAQPAPNLSSLTLLKLHLYISVQLILVLRLEAWPHNNLLLCFKDSAHSMSQGWASCVYYE